MKLRCHLVIAEGKGGKVLARRITQRRPYLDSDEAVIALELEIPEDVFDAPLFTVEVEKRQIEVAVEALEVENE